MAAHFDGDPTRRHGPKVLRQCLSRGRHTPFHAFVTVAGERTVPARFIAQIDADRHRIGFERRLAALRALFLAAMLLYAGLLFAPRVRFRLGQLIAKPARRPAFSSHLWSR